MFQVSTKSSTKLFLLKRQVAKFNNFPFYYDFMTKSCCFKLITWIYEQLLICLSANFPTHIFLYLQPNDFQWDNENENEKNEESTKKKFFFACRMADQSNVYYHRLPSFCPHLNIANIYSAIEFLTSNDKKTFSGGNFVLV